jgi:hypothetical protein
VRSPDSHQRGARGLKPTRLEPDGAFLVVAPREWCECEPPANGLIHNAGKTVHRDRTEPRKAEPLGTTRTTRTSSCSVQGCRDRSIRCGRSRWTGHGVWQAKETIKCVYLRRANFSTSGVRIVIARMAVSPADCGALVSSKPFLSPTSGYADHTASDTRFGVLGRQRSEHA